MTTGDKYVTKKEPGDKINESSRPAKADETSIVDEKETKQNSAKL